MLKNWQVDFFPFFFMTLLGFRFLLSIKLSMPNEFNRDVVGRLVHRER
jgi:hypothetical protein